MKRSCEPKGTRFTPYPLPPFRLTEHCDSRERLSAGCGSSLRIQQDAVGFKWDPSLFISDPQFPRGETPTMLRSTLMQKHHVCERLCVCVHQVISQYSFLPQADVHLFCSWDVYGVNIPFTTQPPYFLFITSHPSISAHVPGRWIS